MSTTLRSSKRAAPYVEKPHSAELKAELSKVGPRLSIIRMALFKQVSVLSAGVD